MKTYTLKVLEIRHETNNTITICFKQPGLKKIKYQAGQYLTLIFRINGRRYIRPYSFSSAPEIDNLLEVTVKRVPNGIVSNYIHDKIQVGEDIEVFPPMGNFIFPKGCLENEIFLWGVGSGITPLYSLLKSILHDPELNSIHVNLIYGNHNIDNTIFWKEIQELKFKFPERLNVLHFHTRLIEDDINNEIVKGRIQAQKVILNFEKMQIKNSLHFICGPVDLKENIYSVLKSYSLPDSCIFIEDFILTKNPKDFEKIENQSVIVQFNGIEKSVLVKKGKSILESALDANLELPYSCQTGNCSTCKGKLISGNIEMIGINYPRTDLESDEFLLCCSYPLDDKVVVSI